MKYFALLLFVASSLAAHPIDYLVGEGFSGLHAGGMIGISSSGGGLESTSTIDFGLVPEQPPVPFGSVFRAEVCKRGLWGELYLGYGCTAGGWFYLGARLGANFTSSQIHATLNCGSVLAAEEVAIPLLITERVSLKMNDVEPTIDFRPGLLWCGDTMLFALIGAAYNRAEIITSVSMNIPELANIAISPVRVASNLVGCRLGVGLEQLICCRYGLILSYVYTLYPTQHVKFDQAGAELFLRGQSGAVRVRPSKQEASLGVAYYF
jgi:hypothetical protein